MLDIAAVKVKSSGLTPKEAADLGMYSIESALVLGSNFKATPSLVIPYYDIAGKPLRDATVPFFRVRYLDANPSVKGFNASKAQRYSQPAFTSAHAYFPKSLPWSTIAENTDEPIIITEGELKAAKAAAHNFSAIGLGGVHNFRAAKDGIFWLPELETIKWARRAVYVAYDSDYVDNPMVCHAINLLCEELQERGAKPRLISLPDVYADKKTGLDDFLIERGEEKLVALMAEAEPLVISTKLWEMNDELTYVRDPGIIIASSDGESYNIKMSPAGFTGHSDWATQSTPERVVKPGGSLSYDKVSAAAAWIKWPLRKSVAKITYAPGAPKFTDDGLFNEWNGWGCEPKKGDIKPWTDLTKFLFEDAEAEFLDWFLDWCAYPIQYPGTKLFSAVIVHGRATGTGKSLVGYTLGSLYGYNFTKVTNRQLKSSFNTWAANKQFILGDEISGTDKRAESDELKAVITQEEISINTKNVPEYTIPDVINYYFTSNHADAFYIEDKDSRYAIHEVTHDEPLPDEFYRKYHEWRTNGGPSHLFYYLLHRDTSNFNPHAPAFKTAAKARMVVHGRSDLGAWCADLRENPDAYLMLGKMRHRRDLFTAKDILAMYQQNHDPSGKVTINGMSRALAAAGFAQAHKGNPIRLDDGSQSRFFIVRNTAKWKKASLADLLKNTKVGPL